MALWRWYGRGWVRSSMASYNLNSDVYLCCPGPSLKKTDVSLLTGPGIFKIAVNTAYPFVYPDMWVGVDTPACFDRYLWWEPFIKIVNGGQREARCLGTLVKECPNTHFVTLDRSDAIDIFNRLGHRVEFVFTGNTFILAMHLCIWLGAKHIYLVGTDFGGGADYHDGRVLTKRQRSDNKDLYNFLVASLNAINEHAKHRNIEIVSCTPGSPINSFLRYAPIEEAVSESKSRLPRKIEETLLHSDDARETEWSERKAHVPVGVMIGVDKEQDWLVDWWYEHFIDHGGKLVPLTCVDFGMFRDRTYWCKKNGIRILRPGPVKFRKSWFCKPFGILRSRFQRTIWMDLDCVVQHDLQPFFEYVMSVKKFAAVRDPHAGSETNKKYWYNSGVLVVRHGAGIVSEWAAATYRLQQSVWGDQDVLAWCLEQAEHIPEELPDAYNHLRCVSVSRTATIMHMTGLKGKVTIEAMMVKEGVE